MRACHWIRDKEAGRVLIPGCWGVAVHGDLAFCTCRRVGKRSERESHDPLELRVNALEEEVGRLRAILSEYVNQK